MAVLYEFSFWDFTWLLFVPSWLFWLAAFYALFFGYLKQAWYMWVKVLTILFLLLFPMPLTLSFVDHISAIVRFEKGEYKELTGKFVSYSYIRKKQYIRLDSGWVKSSLSERRCYTTPLFEDYPVDVGDTIKLSYIDDGRFHKNDVCILKIEKLGQ